MTTPEPTALSSPLSAEQISHDVLSLSDGRLLSYLDIGHQNGRPVFYCHGSPGSRLESLAMRESAIARNYRIIAPDRPGMGQSTFHPGYTLLSYVQDMVELADALSLETFGIVGHSGGGVTALSCALAIPERLDFVCDLAGWAPASAPELRSHMTALDRFFAERCIPAQEINQPSTIPVLFQFPFTLIGLAAKYLSPDLFLRLLQQANYFCKADAAILQQRDSAEFLLSTLRESFSQGSEGPAYDALLRYQDFGFSLSDIQMPVHIFHGDRDISAPYRFAEYKHHHIPNSTLHTFPGEGHFFLWEHWNDILDVVELDVEQGQK